ncbi:hypothetical protein Clacol_010055 [Clathrus columnatus]|uniref:Uncharacterized protein n=1 Tax=Clathrus columnatus TaxID=1419009 RepID=A0AAV5APU5_9AGAM|nr:hypothetical protein Clacol_010055 [Clathrus columnatus]
MTSSRIPQLRKANLPEKHRVSDADEIYDVEKLHSRLVELSYPHLDTLTTAELSRLLQGRAGEALSFLITHFIGRERAIHIRQALHKLRQLPRHQVRDVFPPDSLVEKLHRTELDVLRTRREVEKKQEELRQLIKTYEYHAMETEQMERHLKETRIKVMLLEALLSEEKIRVARMRNLKDVLDKVRQERAKKADVNIDVLLDQIRQTTLNSLTPQQQPERINNSVGNNNQIEKLEKESDGVTPSLNHVKENVLKKTGGPLTPELNLRIERDALFNVISPTRVVSNAELDSMRSELCHSELRADRLLTLFRHLAEDTSRQQQFTDFDEIRQLIENKGGSLIGYIDVLRRRIIETDYHAVDDRINDPRINEFRDALRLPIGVRPDAILRSAEEVPKYKWKINDLLVERLQTTIASLPIFDTSARELSMNAQNVRRLIIALVIEGRDAHEEKSLKLLQRKNEKAERLTHELERDARKFLKEGEALHSGQLDSKGSRKARF